MEIEKGLYLGRIFLPILLFFCIFFLFLYNADAAGGRNEDEYMKPGCCCFIRMLALLWPSTAVHSFLSCLFLCFVVVFLCF